VAPRILVVEDNEDNRALVVKVLRRHGYELVEAASAEEGLTLAEGDPPDLVLMDLNLTGMSGLDATRRLKRTEGLGHVPVIALTADAMVGDREKALEAGCDGYLSKPIDVRKLPDQVAGYLKETRP
jgi:two-component system cell cycle response regulator DivK